MAAAFVGRGRASDERRRADATPGERAAVRQKPRRYGGRSVFPRGRGGARADGRTGGGRGATQRIDRRGGGARSLSSRRARSLASTAGCGGGGGGQRRRCADERPTDTGVVGERFRGARPSGRRRRRGTAGGRRLGRDEPPPPARVTMADRQWAGDAVGSAHAVTASFTRTGPTGCTPVRRATSLGRFIARSSVERCVSSVRTYRGPPSLVVVPFAVASSFFSP